MLPPDVAKRWLKIYAIQPSKNAKTAGQPLLIAIRKAPKGRSVQGWTWTHGSKRPKRLSAQQLKQFKPWLNKGLPQQVTIKLNQSEEIKVRKQKLLFTYEPVRQYGMLGRLAKSWVGDPINRMTLIEVNRGSSKLIGLTEEIEIR